MPIGVEDVVRAELTDAQAILRLQKLAYQSEARLYGDWSIPPLTQTLEDLRREFDHKTVLKVQRDGVIVGSVRAALRNGVCEIGRLIVHPDHQRQSIGTHLMQAIEAAFPHASRYALFTGARSVGNVRLYGRLGYEAMRTERLSPSVALIYMETRQARAPH